MTYLQAAKKYLSDKVIVEFIQNRDLDNLSGYESYFKLMGRYLAMIEGSTSLGKLITELETGAFEDIRWFGDEDDINDLMSGIDTLIDLENKRIMRGF